MTQDKKSHHIKWHDHHITWHDTSQLTMLTPRHLTTNHITSSHPASSLMTSKQVTSPPWNGRRLVHSKEMVWASRWSVALRTFYRQILALVYSSFPFWNFRPQLARELFVYIVWHVKVLYVSRKGWLMMFEPFICWMMAFYLSIVYVKVPSGNLKCQLENPSCLTACTRKDGFQVHVYIFDDTLRAWLW